MDEQNYSNPPPIFRSRLSFQPLIRAWKEIIRDKPGGAGKTYNWLLKEVSKHPELLEPIDDFKILEKHHLLIDQIMETVFPVPVLNEEKLFAVTEPFSYKTIFASKLFKQIIPGQNENYLRGTEETIQRNIASAKLNMAYKLIADKFYNISLPGNIKTICSKPDPEQNLNRYLETEFDTQFTDVTASGELPILPEYLFKGGTTINDISFYQELEQLLPLDQFIFEGIVIVYIRDITEQEAFRVIGEILEGHDLFTDTRVFTRLQQEISYFLNKTGIQIGITSFFNSNNHAAFEKLDHSASIILRSLPKEEKSAMCKQLKETFKNNSSASLLIPEINENAMSNYNFLKGIARDGWASGCILPLHKQKEIIGCFEFFFKTSFAIDAFLVSKARPLIKLLENELQKKIDHLESEVNKIIKEQFTAVQSSVEWRFTEAAVQYLGKLQKGEEPKIEPIVFDNVYPLYGAIDIRNSSGERNFAVQRDMLEQLQWIKKILVNAGGYLSFPLLNEVELRVEQYINSVTNFLFTEDEQTVLSFLSGEATELLKHLQEMIPEISEEITNYFLTVDDKLHMLNSHRKKFENSITQINNYIARFLDREQTDAQKIYPHYFERFVTDGVDFNIYIGQSITPGKKFNAVYLKNLKLWQLTALVKAAQHIHRMEKELPVALQTTQLILVHSKSISISFRTAERKFDVDGVYNVRYEVMKKRIDKVHIKNSNERLTKPGTIAIVYSHEKEAEEYLQYINYLKKQHLVTDEAERYDLEDLQGISGLKGLRVKIMMENIVSGEEKNKSFDLPEKAL